MLTPALVLSLVAQTSGPACNNQARVKTSDAGNHSTGKQDCPQFSFTVTIAGQQFNFSMPGQCDIGRREQDKDCFECSGPSQGNHCKANGFQAIVKIYSIGGGNPCPSIPDPLPSTLAEASAAIACAELPLLHSEPTNCASVRTCEESMALEGDSAASLVLGDGRGARRSWQGNVRELLGSRAEKEDRFAQLARMSVDELPPWLAEPLVEAGAIDGAELTGSLDISFHSRGELKIVNRHEFTAYVAGGRLHVRTVDMVPDGEGGWIPAGESVLQDGDAIVVEPEGSARGHAYLPGYFDLAAVTRAKLAPFQILDGWRRGPLTLLRLPGTHYEAMGSGKELQVLETYPGIQGPGADGSALFRFGIDQVVPRLRSVELRNGSGALRMRRSFEQYAEVAPGILRPMRITETTFDPEGRVEIQRLLVLHSAHALALEEAPLHGWLVPLATEWYVFE